LAGGMTFEEIQQEYGITREDADGAKVDCPELCEK
jgi:uncharacterized protein (DUF433 family)